MKLDRGEIERLAAALKNADITTEGAIAHAAE